MSKQIVLVISPLRFYTASNDENMFFEWLNRIPCILSYKGVGRALHITCSTRRISQENLLNLMGLFARYGFDVNILRVFETKRNQKLFD